MKKLVALLAAISLVSGSFSRQAFAANSNANNNVLRNDSNSNGNSNGYSNGASNASNNPSNGSSSNLSNGASNNASNGNNGSNGSLNIGQTGCQNGCSGNSGQGVGNTGPGNQGNSGTNGNAGGAANGNANGSANGNGNGNANGNANGNGNGNANGNANGNGNGNANGNANGNSDGQGDGNSDGNGDGKTDGNGNDNSNANRPEQQKAKRELKSKLMPAFYLDFDSGRQVVNLTAHDPRKASTSMVSDYNPVLDTLVYGDYQRGFKVVDFSRIEGGLGARLMFFYINASGLLAQFWAHVGLVPMVGKEVVSVRYAPNHSAVEQLPRLISAPMDAKDLDSWTVGDAATFTSKGGVVFMAGAGFSYLGGNLVVVAQGNFQTYVEKADDRHVFVKLTNSKVNSVATQAQAALLSIGTSKFKELAGAFSFMIDVKDPVGEKAYADLVRGNVAAIQEMAKKGTVVRHWEKIETTQVGTFRNIFFGLPIIANIAWASGQMYTLAKTESFFNDTRSTSQYGVYLREKRSRMLHRHKVKTEAFYGSVYAVDSASGENLLKGMFGQYVWSSDNDNTSHWKLSAAMKELVRKTGMRKEVMLNVPTMSNMHYTSVDLRVTLSEEQTLKLMSAAAQSTREKMADAAMARLTDYFRKGDDVNELCADNELEAQTCQSMLQYRTKKATREMHRALADMAVARMSGQDAEFVKAYAAFGKTMSENQFTFQTALQLAGAGVAVDYLVQGAEVSAYALTLESTDDPTVFRQVQRSVGNFNPVGQGRPTLDRGVIFTPGRPGTLVPTQP